MPALIAAPWLGTAIAGIAGGTGAIVGAKMQSGAARKVADTQTTAANYAADKQEAANQRAEAFQRQAAQNAYLNDEAARRGNYEQWAATEGRRGSIGVMLGLGPRNIPAYVPGVDPGFDGGGATSGTMPVDGRPPLSRVDQFGRGPSDPLYGTPVPSPRARKTAPPDVSVGSSLLWHDPTKPVILQGPNGEIIDLSKNPTVIPGLPRQEVFTATARRGTPGSVGSYLRSA